MDKNQLSQLYWLTREIDEDQRRLDELKSLATSCTSRITGMPRSPGVVNKLPQYVAEIADLEALIDLNIKKCFYELSRLNRFINSIEDSEMRTILSLRYISGRTWQQIAFSVNHYDESYVRRKHNSFISSFNHSVPKMSL